MKIRKNIKSILVILLIQNLLLPLSAYPKNESLERRLEQVTTPNQPLELSDHIGTVGLLPMPSHGGPQIFKDPKTNTIYAQPEDKIPKINYFKNTISQNGENANCSQTQVGVKTRLLSQPIDAPAQSIKESPIQNQPAATEQNRETQQNFPRDSSFSERALGEIQNQVPTQTHSSEPVPLPFKVETEVNRKLAREYQFQSERSPAAPVSNEKSNEIIQIFEATQNAILSENTAKRKKTIKRFFKETIKNERNRIREVSFDQNELRLNYLEKPVSEFKQNIQRSFKESQQLLSLMRQAKGEMTKAEKIKYTKLLENARDQAKETLETIQENPDFFNSNRSLSEIQQSPKSEKEKEILNKMSSVIGGLKKIKNADSDQSLSSRLMMLNGLPPEQRRRTLTSLRNSIKRSFASGEVVELPHNGGVIEFNQSQLSCSQFVTQILPTHLRKSELTSYSLWGIGRYLKNGYFPDPPQWESGHLSKLKGLSTQFERVAHERGEAILPGDLIVYLIPGLPNGHLFLIKSIHPESLMTQVIEYKRQGKSNYNIRPFPLSHDSVKAKERYFRVGLTILRFKDQAAKDCQINLKRVQEIAHAETKKEGGQE